MYLVDSCTRLDEALWRLVDRELITGKNLLLCGGERGLDVERTKGLFLACSLSEKRAIPKIYRVLNRNGKICYHRKKNIMTSKKTDNSARCHSLFSFSFSKSIRNFLR